MDQILIGNKAGDCNYFDDSVELMAFRPFRVSSMKIFFTNEAILGLQSLKTIKCSKHTYAKMFGVSTMKLTLQDDEAITYIEGHYGERAIHRLLLRTNKKQNIQVGVASGQSFEFKIPDGYTVGSFSGGVGKCLCYLQLQLIQENDLEGKFDEQGEYSWQNFQLYLQKVDQFKEGQDENLLELAFRHIPSHIQVCDPRTTTDKVDNQLQQTFEDAFKLSKYVQFRIKVLNHNNELQTSCYRRYKDFSQLRDLLINKWPGVYVPPLPPRDLIKDFESTYVETRRRHLEYFIIKLSYIPFFTDTVEWGLFVARGKKPEDNKTELRQVHQKLKELTFPATYEQIKLRYQTAFAELIKLPPVNEIQRNKVSEFYTFLQKAQILLEQFTQFSSSIGQTYKKYVNYTYRFSRQVLPDFQQLYIDESLSNSHDPNIQVQNLTKKLDFHKQLLLKQSSVEKTDSESAEKLQVQPILQDEAWQIQWNTYALTDLHDFCTMELREVQTYISSINYVKGLEIRRNKLELKIQQNPNETSTYKLELDQIQQIWSTLIKCYSVYYIDQQILFQNYNFFFLRFFKERQEFYTFIINKMAKLQVQNLEQSLQYWKCFKEQLSKREGE